MEAPITFVSSYITQKYLVVCKDDDHAVLMFNDQSDGELIAIDFLNGLAYIKKFRLGDYHIRSIVTNDITFSLGIILGAVINDDAEDEFTFIDSINLPNARMEDYGYLQGVYVDKSIQEPDIIYHMIFALGTKGSVYKSLDLKVTRFGDLKVTKCIDTIYSVVQTWITVGKKVRRFCNARVLILDMMSKINEDIVLQ